MPDDRAGRSQDRFPDDTSADDDGSRGRALLGQLPYGSLRVASLRNAFAFPFFDSRQRAVRPGATGDERFPTLRVALEDRLRPSGEAVFVEDEARPRR